MNTDSPTRRQTRRCVLVIEDDPVLSTLVADVLRDEGYTALVAHDGAVALHYMQTVSPAAILLDLHLPGMDGNAFVTAYRGRDPKDGPHAPIILCTGTDAIEAAEQTEHLGAVGFLAKPFDLDTLLAVVARHTGHAGTHGSALTG
ncbi:MAG TPA: response regulator [Chloroflexota bacterium]|nr:response regulator [Chloroflexota bacterium]